jgi:predicted CoA-binding protein
MESDWRNNLLVSTASIRDLLAQVRRVAVLGIRSERYPDRPAFYVPSALARAGLEIIPVPVRELDVDTILGRPVYHHLADIPGAVDLVDVRAYSATRGRHSGQTARCRLVPVRYS